MDRFGRGYAAAIAATALALALRSASVDLVGPSTAALPFLGAVMFAAWIGGLRPGLFATALGALGIVAPHVFTPPPGLPLRTWFFVAAFVALGACVSLLCGSLHAHRRRAEERLELANRNAARFRELAASVPEMVFVRELQGGDDYLNARWEDALGVTPPGADIECWVERVHADDRERVREAWTQGFASGESFRAECRLQRRDGRHAWFALHARPIADGGGRVQRWVGVLSDVHELRTALDARSDADARLRLALEAAQMGTWDVDYATGALRCSDEVGPLFGKPRGHVFPTLPAWLHEIHPDDRAAIARDVLRPPADVSREAFEYRVLLPDGTTRWLQSRGRALRDAHGRRVRATGIVQDVTMQRRLEAQLRAEEERLRLAIEATGAGYYDHDLETGRLVWSERARRILDVPPEAQPSTELMYSLVVPEDRPIVAEAIQRGAVEREPNRFACEFRVRRRDGEIRHLMTLAVSTFAGPPDARRRVRNAGLVLDITERRRAEAVLADAQRQLQIATDAMPSGVARLDRERRLLWVNRAYAGWVGSHPAELVGRTLDDVIGAKACAQLAPWIERVLAGEEVDFEVRLDAAIVRDRWTRATYTPTRDADGRVDGWVAVLADVTERRALEERLRLADRRKDEFLATLAHELRNPLAPMRYAMRLLQPGVPRDAADDARRIVERQLKHMARLVDDLLDVSRITRGVLELRREAIDLAQVVEAALDATRPAIEAGRLELHVEVEPHLPVYGDATRLAQALGNVLGNAAKYTDAGGRVELLAHALGDGSLEIVVRDTGIGIAPEMLPRIFDLFTQAERAGSRAQGGLGIGLSLARRLVELHGGTLDASSAGPGRGSEFVLRLPRHAAAPVHPSERAPTVVPLDRGRPRVLIAEDNADAATSLAMLLELSGFAPAIAQDGQVACEMAAVLRPHAIVFDIGMPRMDGLEAARFVRRQEWGGDVLLIAVTGWGQEQDRRRTREAGFDAHLTKPVDPDDLLELLARRKRSGGANRA